LLHLSYTKSCEIPRAEILKSLYSPFPLELITENFQWFCTWFMCYSNCIRIYLGNLFPVKLFLYYYQFKYFERLVLHLRFIGFCTICGPSHGELFSSFRQKRSAEDFISLIIKYAFILTVYCKPKYTVIVSLHAIL